MTDLLTNVSSRALLRVAIVTASIVLLCYATAGTGHAQVGTAPLLFVCNHDSRNISVIDTGMDEVVQTIDGLASPYGVAVSPDGARLYVTSKGGMVSAIDTATGRLQDNVDIGADAGRCLISPDGSRLYIESGTEIVALNVSALKVDARIPTDGKALAGLAVSPDGSRLYVADRDGRAVITIDTRNATMAGSMRLDTMPMRLVVSPDGSRVYAACVNNAAAEPFGTTVWSWLSPGKLFQAILDLLTGGGRRDINAIYEIDAADGTVARTIDTGGIPFGIAMGPDGSRIYAACGEHDGSYVEVIDTATGRVTDRISAQLGLWATTMLFGTDTWADGQYMYVISAGQAVVRVELCSTAHTSFITVGDEPAGMAASPDGRSLYVACRRGNVVAVVDACNATVRDTLRLWWDPQYIALSPDGSRAYVTSENAGTVTVLNTSDQAITGTIGVPASPRQVAISPDGGKVFVAHYSTNFSEDGLVSVIDTRSNAVIRELRVGVNPRGFAFSPDGRLLYVVFENPTLMMITPWSSEVKQINERWTDNLYVIDVASGDVIQTGNVRYMPSGIAVSQDGARLYVTCTNGSVADAGDVQVIDAGSLATIRTTRAGAQIKGIAISPDGKELYLIHGWPAHSMTVIDAANGMKIASIPDLYEPGSIVFSRDGGQIYVSCSDWPGHVSVIDARNKKVIKRIEVGTWPTGMALSP
jgi:YVTN family beta-propeller protein